MIRSCNKIQNSIVKALDGDIGKLKDLYFDDRSWKIKYFVVELGSLFPGNVFVPPVLVSPIDDATLKVQLTKAELLASPHADSLPPALFKQSFQSSIFYSTEGNSENILSAEPVFIVPVLNDIKDIAWDFPHLRSCKDVSKYELIAQDGNAGTNQDLLIDDSQWLVRFIIASIDSNGESEEKIYDPHIIEDIDWALEIVNITVPMNQAFFRPCFDASRHLDISYEMIVKDISIKM